MADVQKWAVLAKDHAGRQGVVAPIHPDDHIFNFLVSHPGFSADDSRVQYYFEDGANSARQFLELLQLYLPARPLSVLEFASGYGCVTRHLVASNKIAHLVACDIHPAAMQFLQNETGVETVLSASVPEDLTLPVRYDCVFALSFFSHMPRLTWGRWLARLADAVAPGGILVFTTHGQLSRKHFSNPALDDEGFWFVASSEQKDLATDEYGQTIVTPAFVEAQIRSIPSLHLIETREGFWWGHQDLFVARKIG